MRTPVTSWPGYAPWADTVAAALKELTHVTRSFWLFPELIPLGDRENMALLYCFCRRLDDAVDGAPDAEGAREALQRWRDEMAGRAPARPLIAAFLACAGRTGLPLRAASDLLDGMESDLGDVRLPDDDALLRYSYQVSSAVGLMLAHLAGMRGVESDRLTIDLGIALQISNVLLGVEEDARLGRVYLPASRLAAVGLSADDVMDRPSDPRLRPVLRELAELAARYYRSAELLSAVVPLRYRHGVLLVGRAYGGLGRRAAEGKAAPATPSGLSFGNKLFHLVELIGLAWHPCVMGIRRPPPHDAALHRALAGMPGAHA